MDLDTLRATDALLDAALDLPPAARAAFVEAEVPPALRAHVRRLLAAAEAEDPLLDDAPVSVAELRGLAGEGSAVGERVGPYRIEGPLGEGGMGRVYRAERADGAFERTVALKLVRRSLALAGLDVSERLRRERAVLASLEHPHIARLYGGGETDDGVPWVAMELIDGEPITAFADARGLGVRERVALAADVCRAVEHAHRRLVVHRDLKPSNVFVAEGEDGAPVVKLLDFGIARLLDADDGMMTQTGGALLTPAYAAPEQLLGGQITTATDVWALGALVYELLTGARPFPDGDVVDGRPTRSRTLRRTLERTTRLPPAPSRAVAPGRDRPLRGDLDAIVLHALEPEPERRYASAGALADDLARHLEGLPVVARPASRWYLAGSFVQRHRGAVAAASAVTVALVVGLAVSLVSLGRERDARTAAQAEATRADAAFEFVVDLFGGEDGAPLALSTPAGDLLAVGERRARALGPGRDAERAVAFKALREVRNRLIHRETALEAAREAWRAARAAYGPGHPHTLGALGDLATSTAILGDLGRADPLRAETERGMRAHGEAGRAALARFRAEYGRAAAWSIYHHGRHEERIPEIERMLIEAEVVLRARGDSSALAGVVSGRGHLAELTGGLAAAAPLFEEAYEIDRALSGDRIQSLTSLNNWADVLLLSGDAEAAVPAFDTLVARLGRVVGPDHPARTLALTNASLARLERGRPGDLDRALAWTAEFNPAASTDEPWLQWAFVTRLRVLRAARDWPALDATAARLLAAFGPDADPHDVAWARTERAHARFALGDHAAAVALAQSALRDADDETVALAHLLLACVDSARGARAAAREQTAAARAAVADAELPPHYQTPRLVRNWPRGSVCDSTATRP
ncbi:protein kinase domain-containing protein [Rubrivirga sp. IMCC43871]|uniref:serine/threonine-protein kinase n=1 Tax=Rubrivirga sp. IMCC43871 TaxID=3391575 RepID=UPI00398FC6D4